MFAELLEFQQLLMELRAWVQPLHTSSGLDLTLNLHLTTQFYYPFSPKEGTFYICIIFPNSLLDLILASRNYYTLKLIIDHGI